MNKIDLIISRLDKVKSFGNGRYEARCPAHDDRSPSLRVTEADDGKILIKCFGGCAVDDVVTAIGLTLSDLFPDPVPAYGSNPRANWGYKSEWFEKLVYETTILSVFLGDLLAAGAIQPLDADGVANMERAKQAINTIDEIRALYGKFRR